MSLLVSLLFHPSLLIPHHSLLLLHLPAAALDGASAAFGDDHLRAAGAAEIHFADLIRHGTIPPVGNPSLLSSKYRFPLAEESAYAFSAILGGLQEHIEVFLQTQPLIERQIHRFVYRFFS